MNLVSAMVGLTITGIAAPTILEMSVTPIIAQKRASNFGKAESRAVVYAAANEGVSLNNQTAVPEDCDRDTSNAPAFTITCKEGKEDNEDKGRFFVSVSRSYIGELPNSNASNSGQFPYPINPYGFNGHQCLSGDNWGLSGAHSNWDPVAKEWTGQSCVPSAAWTQRNYDNSEPRDWLWDINRLNNRGYHDDYDEYVSST